MTLEVERLAEVCTLFVHKFVYLRGHEASAAKAWWFCPALP